MDIGIIHLTDLHIEEKTDIGNKINSLKNAIANEFYDISKKYLIVTGDIANTGKKSEYEYAKKLISVIINELDIVKIVIVPGNHDCNFEYDNQIRKNCVLNPDYNTIGDDGSVIEQAIHIQRDFWEFYSEFNDLPNSKLAYQINDTVDGKKICFNCFNTSWMSSIEEKPGNLFFPVKILDTIENENNISISVLHHPLSWFSPNSRSEFQDYLDSIFVVKLMGHEHENKSISITNLDTDINVLEFSGEAFNDNNASNSGFQIIRIRLEENNLILKKYEWKDDIYENKSEKKIPLQKGSNRKLKIRDTLFKDLDDIKIPLLIEGKNIPLSKIFVFPDLEEKKKDYKKLDSYIDSQELLNSETLKRVVVYGESQIGKTSLINILFIRLFNSGFYPFLLNGKDIKSKEIDKIIKKKFHKIYSDDSQIDRYFQIEKKRKILLIDDFHKNTLNFQNLKQFIIEANLKYENIIITTGSSTELSADTQSIFNEYRKLTIRPLGYAKTDSLITNYYRRKNDFLSLGEQEKLTTIKTIFDQIRNLSGDKTLPSYPIFILSLLRTLDEATCNLNETSYGYCYESLLYLAFKSEAKLKENQLTYYLSFIEQLAFALFNEKKMEFNESFLSSFYDNYKTNHFIDEFYLLKSKLIDSYILKEYDGVYQFGYKYIFYFLVAKHIAGIIQEKEGKNIINALFENLDREENANILVFITHHTKNNEFIEESVLRTMEPFEKVEPITLKKDCNYYSLISGLAENVTKEILKADINPDERRKENLRDIDKNNKIISTGNEIDESFKPYVKAVRSIDIVSQIIKNRIGYLTKDKIATYVEEIYLAGFRMIGAIGETYKKAKDEILDNIVESILNEREKKAKHRKYLLSKSMDKEEIKNEVNKFFEIINLQICLGIFSKLADSVGIKDIKMQEIYSNVANKINTPAAKLVSFSIKSYCYDDVSTHEIEELSEEFEKNPVALKILKARVISYVYNNHIDFKKKQKIADILKLEFRSTQKRPK